MNNLITIIATTLIWVIYSMVLAKARNKEAFIKALKNKEFIITLIIGNVIEIVTLKYIGLSTGFYILYFINIILLAIARIDVKEHIISNKLLIPLAVCALASLILIHKDKIAYMLISLVITFAILFSLSKLTKNDFGMGDVKLLTVLSLYFGAENILAVLFLSSLMVAIIGVFFLIRSFSNKKKEIPLSPFILIATIIVSLAG